MQFRLRIVRVPSVADFEFLNGSQFQATETELQHLSELLIASTVPESPQMPKLPLATIFVVLAGTFCLDACLPSNIGAVQWPPKSETQAAPVAAPVTAPVATTATAVPLFSPVLLIALENHPYTSIVGNANMPFLNGLINQYAVNTNLVAAGTGSVPDYFMVTTGNIVSTSTSYVGPYTGDNLARSLILAGRTWKAYVQGIPNAGYVGTGTPPYVKYHNPFAYFSDVLDGGPQQNNIVPMTELSTDISSQTLSDFSFVVPDNQHNGHDCPPGMTTCSDAQVLAAVDQLIQTYVAAFMKTPAFQRSGLVVIWWDEGNTTTERTALTLAGPQIKRGLVSTTLFHDEDLLRTIIEGLGLTLFPNASATASDLSEMFNPAANVYPVDPQHQPTPTRR